MQRRQHFLRVALLSGLVATACGKYSEDASAVSQEIRWVSGAAAGYVSVQTELDQLSHPWSIAFLPTDEVLITERVGRLWIVGKGRKRQVVGLPAVYVKGEGGLFDVLPHPNFRETRQVYLSFAMWDERRAASTTAVARGRLVGERLRDVQTIFAAEAWSDRPFHFGGRIVFSPEGYLFVTIGDRFERPQLGSAHPSQSLSTHHGKILRLNGDGSTPTDNPFKTLGYPAAAVWSYGHRNSQGLTFTPDGLLLSHEHGPLGGDELNLVSRGANYGWPIVGHGTDYGYSNAAPVLIHRALATAGMLDPILTWSPSIAPSGLAFCECEDLPFARRGLLIGALTGERLIRVRLGADGRASQEVLLTGFGRIRDVRVAPGGSIYLATDDRRNQLTSVLRLDPIK